MTPPEMETQHALFSRCLDALGLDGWRAAEALNTNTRVIRRWKNGDNDIPSLVWPLLKNLLEQCGELNLAGTVLRRNMGMNRKVRRSDEQLILQQDKNDTRWWVIYHDTPTGLVELERSTNRVTLAERMAHWRFQVEQKEPEPAEPRPLRKRTVRYFHNSSSTVPAYLARPVIEPEPVRPRFHRPIGCEEVA